MYPQPRAKSATYAVLSLMLFSIGLLAISAPQRVQATATSSPILQAATNDVGIIKGAAGCPSGSGEIFIHMDNEDASDGSITYAWVGATSVDGNANINYYFCRVSGNAFTAARGRFAVLSLGLFCPQGSVKYNRYFDNEDSKNKNSSSGNLYPNWVQSPGNSQLVFCVFDNTGFNALPGFGVEYGVFSNQLSGQPGFIFSDDENRRNGDYYEDKDGKISKLPQYPNIIDGDFDTTIYVTRIP